MTIWSIFPEAERWLMMGNRDPGRPKPLYGMSFRASPGPTWSHDTIRLCFADGSTIDRPFSRYLYLRYVLLGRRS